MSISFLAVIPLFSGGNRLFIWLSRDLVHGLRDVYMYVSGKTQREQITFYKYHGSTIDIGPMSLCGRLRAKIHSNNPTTLNFSSFVTEKYLYLSTVLAIWGHSWCKENKEEQGALHYMCNTCKKRGRKTKLSLMSSGRDVGH